MYSEIRVDKTSGSGNVRSAGAPKKHFDSELSVRYSSVTARIIPVSVATQAFPAAGAASTALRATAR